MKDINDDEFELRMDWLEYNSGPELDAQYSAFAVSGWQGTKEEQRLAATNVIKMLDEIKRAAQECAEKLRKDGYEG